MAVLTGLTLDPGGLGGLVNENLSVELFTFEPYTAGLTVEGIHSQASFSPTTRHHDIQYAIWPRDGFRLRSYVDDFYYRVHLVPSSLDVGNLVSPQVREVEVWNAFTTPQTLNGIGQTGADGVVLTQPVEAPTAFQPLEARTYLVNVSTNGPPLIAATFTFNFVAGAMPLTVTGRRVVLWPFIPETGHEDVMEWKTDILPSFNNEQRIAIRAAPRQSLQHDFGLDEQQFSRMKAMATGWSHRLYGIPVWSEITPLFTGLSAGATFIPFDTSNADYRNDSLVVLWASDTELEALEITTVSPTGVTLKFPLETAWPPCFVAPLRFARTLAGVDFKRSHNQYITASANFLVTENEDLGNEGSFPLYRGKPVMTDRSAVLAPLSERVARTVDLFDNGSGLVEVDIKNNWVRNVQTLSFIKQTPADVWKLRQWVHARRGRQRSFWLPSWNRDLVLVTALTNTSQAMEVAPIGYAQFYTVKDVMVQLKNGTRLFARITSGSAVDGKEQLLLTATLGVALTPSDIDFICFMSHVRFDSDRIVFRHSDAGRVTASVPIVETPEL